MNNDKPKPRRYYLYDTDLKDAGSIIADTYDTTTFMLFQPAGHHFYLDGVRVAYFPFEMISYVTSVELKPEAQE